MNNENEIERMEQLIDTATRAATKRFTDETVRWVKEHHSYDSRRDIGAAHSKSIYREVAESLVHAGIGDKKQAVKEFAEKLKENMSKRLNDNIALKYSQSTVQSFHDKAQRAIIATYKELYGADE